MVGDRADVVERRSLADESSASTGLLEEINVPGD
jgi:hypothetical protein